MQDRPDDAGASPERQMRRLHHHDRWALRPTSQRNQRGQRCPVSVENYEGRPHTLLPELRSTIKRAILSIGQCHQAGLRIETPPVPRIVDQRPCFTR